MTKDFFLFLFLTIFFVISNVDFKPANSLKEVENKAQIIRSDLPCNNMVDIIDDFCRI